MANRLDIPFRKLITAAAAASLVACYGADGSDDTVTILPPESCESAECEPGYERGQDGNGNADGQRNGGDPNNNGDDGHNGNDNNGGNDNGGDNDGNDGSGNGNGGSGDPNNGGGSPENNPEGNDHGPEDPGTDTNGEPVDPQEYERGGARDNDAPVRVNDENCLRFDNPAGGVQFCGDWSWDGREFSAEGDIAVKTPVGEFTMGDASLRAGRDPAWLDGAANVGFPMIGWMEDLGFAGDAPRAQISLAPGAELGTIQIGEQEMEVDPDYYYLVLDYSTGLGLSFGDNISLSTPGSGTMVIAPEEPLVYVAGDLAGLLTGGLIDDAAFGFSLAGRLPFETENELFDGEEWRSFELDGHFFAQGSVQLGSYPINVAARVFVDADADNDGETVFEGDTNDIAFAAEGNVSAGYSKAGFDLTLPLGTASVVYDGSEGEKGSAYFYADNTQGLFEGTVLEFIEQPRQGFRTYGYFRGEDDFLINVAALNNRIGPFSVREASIQLENDAVTLFSELSPLPRDILGRQAVEITGQVRGDGSYSLTGTADVTVAGFQLASADLTLTDAGLRCEGHVEIPAMGGADIDGAITTTGDAHLRGTANLRPAGLNLANASVSVSQAGAAVSGRVAIPQLGHADIAGHASSNGRFSLNGDAALNPFGLNLADGTMSIDNTGAAISASMNTPLNSIDIAGSVNGNSFSLTGETTIRIPIRIDQEVAQWVTDAAICGVERVTDAARCGVDSIVDGARCGTRAVTDAARCGTRFVEDAAICGTRAVTDAAICGTSVVTNAAVCGTTTVIDALCEAACFIGGCDCSSVQARSCRVPNTCNVPRGCDAPRTCNVANTCDVPASCDIPATCETRVTVPDVDFGAFEGNINVSINNGGAGGSMSGAFCPSTGGGCVNLAGGSLNLDGDPEACIDVPGAGEICAGF